MCVILDSLISASAPQIKYRSGSICSGSSDTYMWRRRDDIHVLYSLCFIQMFLINDRCRIKTVITSQSRLAHHNPKAKNRNLSCKNRHSPVITEEYYTNIKKLIERRRRRRRKKFPWPFRNLKSKRVPSQTNMVRLTQAMLALVEVLKGCGWTGAPPGCECDLWRRALLQKCTHSQLTFLSKYR